MSVAVSACCTARNVNNERVHRLHLGNALLGVCCLAQTVNRECVSQSGVRFSVLDSEDSLPRVFLLGATSKQLANARLD